MLKFNNRCGCYGQSKTEQGMYVKGMYIEMLVMVADRGWQGRTGVIGAYSGTQGMCTVANSGLKGVQGLCTGKTQEVTGKDGGLHTDRGFKSQ